MYHRSTPKLVWYRVSQWVLGGLARVWFRARRQGHGNVPATGPVVLLANHQSHLDPVLIGVFAPRPLSYLARDTLFRGILGPLIRSYDSIPIDREGGGLAGIRATLKRLKQGDAVLMFPEGTRSPNGELQPLKPGFIALVRRGGASIVPVGLAGAYEALPRGGVVPRPVRIAVDYGQPILPATIAQLDDAELLAVVAERMAECLARTRRLAGRAD